MTTQPSDSLLDDLRGLPAAAKIACHSALAHNSMDHDDVVENLRWIQALTTRSINYFREAVARHKQRETYLEREAARLASRTQQALAVQVEAALLDETAFDPHGYFVYVLWGVDRTTPLYVGKSTNVLGRLGTHLNVRPKRNRVHRVVVLRCPNAHAMDSTESHLIAHYQPPWNTVGIRPAVVAS